MSTCEEMFHAYEHEHLLRRDAIIATSGELQEREAHELATIATAIANALVERGSDPATSPLVAELALAAFEHASRLWRDDPATACSVLLHHAAEQVRDVLTSHARDPATP